MARDCLKKNEHLQHNQPSGWPGTDDKTKSKPGKGKGKSKNKGKGKQYGKKAKKGFHEMEGFEDKQETQTNHEYTEWTDTTWDHADNWADAANRTELVLSFLLHGRRDVAEMGRGKNVGRWAFGHGCMLGESG